MGLPGLEQLNITLNRAEQRLVVHFPQVPVIRDFQSVLLSSNWHEVWPPLDTLVQGGHTSCRGTRVAAIRPGGGGGGEAVANRRN